MPRAKKSSAAKNSAVEETPTITEDSQFEEADIDEPSEQPQPSEGKLKAKLAAPLDHEPIGFDDNSDDEDSEDILQTLQSRRKSLDNLSSLDHSNLFANFDPEEEDDIENDIESSRVTKLDQPPMIGGAGARSSMFGRGASSPAGRAISPRLYAQAAQFPTCTQLRVWKWENGIPVGLGAIDAMASEEDLVREFYNAMPKKGEGRCQFKMRPIDINGNELGTEVNIVISEHHAAIQKIRRMKEMGEDDGPTFSHRRGGWFEDDGSNDEPAFVSQFDRMMTSAEKRAEILERQLEEERSEIRRREEQRMQEQVDLATSAAQGVQVLTERMMADESKRAERAMQMQTEQSQTLITTLTSIFAQQQTMLQAQMETQRRQDEYRLEQERQRAQRERVEADQRRERERIELEERRLREREEYDRRMNAEREALERKLLREQKEMEIRLQREKEEMQIKILREKEERESRERWFAEERRRKEQQEREDARQREHDRQRQHERMMRELEVQQQKDREHAERMMILSKQELQNKAMGGLGEMLPMATGMLKKMGLEPMDVVQKIFAPEPEPTSAWSDTLPKLLGAGADIARAALGSKSAPPMPIASAPQALPQLPMDDDFEEIDYQERLAALRRQAIPREAPMAPRTPPPQAYRPPPEGGVISYRQTKLASDMLSEQPPMQSAPPQQEDKVNQAAHAGMTLGEQRDARNAMSDLVQALHGSDQSQWQELITKGIMAEPLIFTYIQAITVREAIRETGADSTLTENIVNALKESSLVPSDLNYGV